MSAFIVEDRTICKIVTWLAWGNDVTWYRNRVEDLGYDLSKDLSVEKLAKDMWALNCNAVDARYGNGQADQMGGRTFKFNFAGSGIGKFEVLKAINCWHYQCSEGDDVPNHPLYKVMETISNSLAQQIVSRMPEYDRIPWA